MLQLNTTRTLVATTQTELTNRQNTVGTNSLAGTTRQAEFKAQSEMAKNGWVNLSNAAKTDIIEVLRTGYYGQTGICQYCENNEGTDIEHIYPKTHFPHRCFVWENYVWACSNCNSRYKSDKFSVFVPTGSTTEKPIPVRRGPNPPPHVIPWTEDGLIINSRTENPMEYLVLDITNSSFHFSYNPMLIPRDQKRALFTRELVGLNREDIVAARKAAYENFILLLNQYNQVNAAATITQIAGIAAPFNINNTLPFVTYKQQVLAKIKDLILTSKHPTVFREILRQTAHLPPELQNIITTSGAATWI
jgi:hypothetical protein